MDVDKELKFLSGFKKKIGGWGEGGREGRCEQRSEVFFGGGGVQGTCELRSEVFVIIQIFFFFFFGGGGGGGGVSSRGVQGGGVRCKNAKKKNFFGGVRSGWGQVGCERRKFL